MNTHITRRALVRSSLFGLCAVPIPNIIYAQSGTRTIPSESPELFHRYPSIDDAIVQEIVGASHFNYDRVKELVTQRPELARATWDWRLEIGKRPWELPPMWGEGT